MANCMHCHLELCEEDQVYGTSDLGSDIVALIKHRLGSQVNIEGVLCSDCFETIIQGLSTVQYEPVSQLNDNTCAMCCRSLHNRRCHALGEASRNYVAERIMPREVPEGALVCYSCWMHIYRELQRQGIIDTPSENLISCVWCSRSLANTHRHSLPEGPEYNYIAAQIHPRVIPLGGRVCRACWIAVRQYIQRQPNIDSPSEIPQLHRGCICVWCQSSLFRRRCHRLLHGPERSEVADRIYPRQIPDVALVCDNCWHQAQENIQRALHAGAEIEPVQERSTEESLEIEVSAAPVPVDSQQETEEKTTVKTKIIKKQEKVESEPESEIESESELSSDEDINNKVLRKEANWYDMDILKKLASIEKNINILNRQVAKNETQYDTYGKEVSYLLNTLPHKHAAELKSKLDKVITNFKTDLVSRGVKLKRKKFEQKPSVAPPVKITPKRKPTVVQKETVAKKKVCRHAELVKQIEKMKANIYPTKPTAVQQKTVHCQPEQQKTIQQVQQISAPKTCPHKATVSQRVQPQTGHSHQIKLPTTITNTDQQKTTTTNTDQQITTTTNSDQQKTTTTNTDQQKPTISHRDKETITSQQPMYRCYERQEHFKTPAEDESKTQPKDNNQFSTQGCSSHQAPDEVAETEEATRSIKDLSDHFFNVN